MDSSEAITSLELCWSPLNNLPSNSNGDFAPAETV